MGAPDPIYMGSPISWVKMSNISYLIIHKDHPVDILGVNGGAETATLWLARTMAALGSRVVVAAQLSCAECSDQGVEFWDLGLSYDVQGILARARGLGSYHLIAASSALPILLSRGEQSCASRFFIAQDQSSAVLGITPQVLSAMVDGLICVSEAQKGLFVKEGADPNKISVIPNGADQSVFHSRSDRPRNLKRLVFAGALVTDKGIDILIRAFPRVRAAIPDATLDIYGSSSMWGREPLFDEREVEGAIPGVRFHGTRPQAEVAEAFRTAAACVIPSRGHETFVRTAVEAQACGCPVVAFDVGGVKEALRIGETGVLVPEVSEQALATALINYLKGPAKISKMSAAGVQLVERKFTWRRVAGLITALCEAVAQVESTYYRRGKIGVISTWNQRCGLATYAQYLFSKFEQGSVAIFSEQGVALERPDEPFVERCWRRGSDDFSALKSAVTRHGVEMLHINMHSVQFFRQPGFAEFLSWARQQHLVIVVQLHSTFTKHADFAAVVAQADCILVHAEQNRLEVIGNGARPDQVQVIRHGVEVLPKLVESQRSALREKLGIAADAKSIVAFGFVQPHKGMEGVLESVLHLRSKGITAQGFILGGVNPSDPNSAEYLRNLRTLSEEHGLGEAVSFVDRFISDAEVSEYLQAADLVLMNYRSQHYEASGACALAIGAGAVVATSGAPPFIDFGDAVWHLTSGYPPTLAAELLLTNASLYETVRSNAEQYAGAYDWGKTAVRLKEIYRQIGVIPTGVAEINAELPMVVTPAAQVEEPVTRVQTAAVSRQNDTARPLRVLIQNRPGTFTQRGGDTIVLEHTVRELKNLGVEVTVDVELTADPARYDIVHLLNFATPDLTQTLGQRAHAAGVPFVVTTLLEDVAMFHNQCNCAAQVLVEYVRHQQNPALWSQCVGMWSGVPTAPGFDNRWLGEHAAALLTNGSRETETVRRYHPNARNVTEVKLGHEVGSRGDAELFHKTYGVKDFVLCVGRLESRKNQLMLLKALEDSAVPVVLVGGGFTYQPDYAEAVQKFKRRGPTLILGRLAPEMLAAAYSAAKVHALPSWYELPGLVSLEAASYGCAVVVTDNGTARDYLGDHAHYCEPGDEQSIRNAIEAALAAPVSPTLRSVVEKFRWDSIGQDTLTVYENILGRKPRVQQNREVTMAPSTQPKEGTQPSAAGFGSYDLSSDVTEFQELLERGELAGKNGEFEKAHELLAKAERINPQSVRLLKARGAILLAASRNDEARGYFERAWSIDPKDARVLCGLGICEMRQERAITAYRYFVDALAVSPESQVAILQLIPCAYALNKFDDLEQALRRFLANNPGDIDMSYCLAGLMYKSGRMEEAAEISQRILQSDGSNVRATELLALISKERGNIAASSVTANSSTAPTAAPSAAGTGSAVEHDSMPTQSNTAKSPVTAAIERIVVPSTPQVMSPASKASSAIDQEIGSLEEAKRHKRVAEVQRGANELLNRPMISPEQREIVMCLKAEVEVLEGRIAEAEKVYAEILDRNPASARAIAGRGVIAAAEGRWDEARCQFERANTYRPRYDLALAGLGLCAWQGGDTTTAWVRFEQALKANPENTRALLGLMQIGYPMQRYAEIAAAIESYLELHPADLEWMYSLAGCYYALTRLDEATEIVNRIRVFKPEHEKANELGSMIDARRRGAAAPAAPEMR
jgi:glycosyltransferase involved in cell wall biosynthesis/Tfp pilus assembly protein PilF